MGEPLIFNQITLITDGFSNQGLSPIEAAKRAFKKNITVNVIGISNKRPIGNQGEIEIENIAKAGGGLHQIVTIEHIAKTVQTITKKAVNKTIQQVVNAQLLDILGDGDYSHLHPEKRIKIAKVVDYMAEYSDLNILLLIDQSSSMLPKLEKVKEAILDFQLSLQARSGKSYVSIATFPGHIDFINIKLPWTNEIKNANSLIHHMNPRGKTPTGPAILSCVSYFSHINNKIKMGVLDEFII